MKPLNNAFCKLVYTYFMVYICVKQKLLSKKMSRILHLWFRILICFGLTFAVTVLKLLCFCSSLCKAIGNQRFCSYDRHNFSGIAAVLLKTSANIWNVWYYLIHYIAKTQSIIYILQVTLLWAWDFLNRS